MFSSLWRNIFQRLLNRRSATERPTNLDVNAAQRVNTLREDTRLWYLCDPSKNTTCTKESCHIHHPCLPGACKMTSNPDYSVDGKIQWGVVNLCEACIMQRSKELSKECLEYMYAHNYNFPCTDFKNYTDYLESKDQA